MSVAQRTLSAADAAKYLGVSKGYLDKLRCYQSPDSPPFVKLGWRVVYPTDALDKWIAERTCHNGKPSKPSKK